MCVLLHDAHRSVMLCPVSYMTLIFVPQGWSKFSDTSGWAQAFRHWGYPDWFRITVGVLELTAVGFLLSGRAAAWGALLIVMIMLGAMGTHIAYDGGRHLTSEVVPMFLSLLVLWFRKQQLRRSADDTTLSSFM